MRVEIKRLQRELVTTVIHVTHDLDEALALGDRMAVLIDGGLRQVGIPSEVIRHPADAMVAQLTGCANVFPAVLSDAERSGLRIRLKTGIGGAVGSADPELFVDPAPMNSLGETFHAVIRAEEIRLLGLVRDFADDVARAARPTPGEPPANILEGTIRNIRLQSIHASVEIEAPPLFTIHLLRPEVERLNLEVGARVSFGFAPSAVHLCPGRVL